MADSNTANAVIESAVVIPEGLKKELAELVAQINGTKVPVTFVVRKDLVGGFTIQIGDRKIDATVVTELKQLQVQLKG